MDQGIFPTQGLNPGLLHCRHQGTGGNGAERVAPGHQAPRTGDCLAHLSFPDPQHLKARNHGRAEQLQPTMKVGDGEPCPGRRGGWVQGRAHHPFPVSYSSPTTRTRRSTGRWGPAPPLSSSLTLTALAFWTRDPLQNLDSQPHPHLQHQKLQKPVQENA